MRLVCATFIGAIVILALIVQLIAGSARDGAFSVPLAIATLILGAVVAVLVPLIGFRAPAIQPGTPEMDAARRARLALTNSTILRLAMSEFVALVAFAAVIVVSGTVVNYLIGAVISIALIIAHCWPSRSNVARIERSLDAQGYRSGLSAALFGAGTNAHPIS